MYKFKIKLLYNEEKNFGTKTELLNLKITLPLAKLNIVPVNIQLVTFLLLSVIRELSIGAKARKI